MKNEKLTEMNYKYVGTHKSVNIFGRVGSVFLLPTQPRQNVNKLLRTYLYNLTRKVS